MAKADIQIHENTAPRPASLSGLRFREDVAFTNAKGEEDKGTRKRVNKALEKLGDVLQRAMGQDEAVLYAVRLQAPIGAFEQYGLGWYVYRITATVLVFTNRRILHLGVDASGKWKGSLKSVAYGDIAKAEPKGWLSGVLWLTYKNGKKEKYWGMRGDGVRKMKALFAALLPASGGESTPAAGMASLCPDCLAPLTEKVYQCAGCGLVFKDEGTMKKRALLIPGGGYFYCGQTLLGVLGLIGEAWLILLIVIFAIAAAATWGKPPAKPDDLGAVGMLVTAVLVLGILMLEKLLVIHHCRRLLRDFISTGQKDPMRMQSAGAGGGSGGWK
ncbi:MAG: hypothetical protein LAN37_03460 [Acidobacteriia bacterium]|nr:hypothetical protein [Terriglobia bacterium]